MLKLYIFFAQEPAASRREKDAEPRQGGLMSGGLWQAEQMHTFMLREITSLYELPLVSLPPLLVAAAFLESESTARKK